MTPISTASPTGHDPLEGLTAGGMIATGARRDGVSSVFEPIIQDAIAQVGAMQGSPSLYLYGSVATGMARVGRSDVDLMTIGLDPESALRMGRDLSVTYTTLCRGVEVGPAQLSDYAGPSDEVYGNRVFLRHYCVHLAGPDVRSGLPDFPANATAARGFNGDIGQWIGRWRTEVIREPYTASLGRRIARKTLVAVAGLVSIHDSTWTTDKVAAARRWGAIRPELEAGLQELVGWSDGETTPPLQSRVRACLEGIVAEIVEDFRHRIGLWSQ